MTVDPATAFSAAKIVASISEKPMSYLGSKLAITNAKIRSRLESTYKQHLEDSYKKCSRINTVFHQDDDINLNEIYQNLYLSLGEKIIKDEDLYSFSDTFNRAVVLGTGGAGKTMMTKYIVCLHCENPIGKIPIFIELRNIFVGENFNFEQEILNQITISKKSLKDLIFEEGLECGIFSLILDGFDEVAPEFSDIIFKSIQALAKRYPKTSMVVTARPELDSRPWLGFDVYKVVPLTYRQSLDLVKKVPFEDAPKSKFIEAFDENFFRMHRSFLQVPLLAVLMLVTFKEFAETPDRITVFYDQAFETLYRKHDISKDVFKRKKHDDMSSDKFRFIFMGFCYLTLLKSKVSFTDSELREFLKKSSEITQIQIDVDAFAHDLVSSVCVLIRDGLDVHFIHRSFQDYFAAHFALKFRGKPTFQLIDSIAKVNFQSFFLNMIFDIDKQITEQEWSIKVLESFITELNLLESNLQWKHLFDECKNYFIFHDDLAGHVHIVSDYDNDWCLHIIGLSKIYGEFINRHQIIWGYIKDFDKTQYKDYTTYLVSNKSELSDEIKADILGDVGKLTTYNSEGEQRIISNINQEFIDSTDIQSNYRDVISKIYSLHEIVADRVTKHRSTDIFGELG